MNDAYTAAPEPIYEGAIVVISDYPDVRWIVQHGLFWYNDDRQCGWFVESLIDGTVLPLDDIDPDKITVVSEGCPHPPGPSPAVDPLYQIERTWITVDTLEARDALDPNKLPMGKIVRVNFTPYGPRCYVWNRVNMQWDIWRIASSDEVGALVAEQVEAADIPGQVAEQVTEAVAELAISGQDAIDVTGQIQDGSAQVTLKIDDITPGNVALTQGPDGLKASVVIPSATVTGVKSGEKVISLDGTELQTTLVLSYDQSINQIQLKGLGGDLVAAVDVTAIISAGTLDGVQLINGSGADAGKKFIEFSFSTASGKQPIRLDVTELVDVYTAGSGLTLHNNQFSIDNTVVAGSVLPAATTLAYGQPVTLTVAAYDVNGLITGTQDVTVTVPSPNIDDLTQSAGDLLLLNCGTSTENIADYATPAEGEAF